MEKHQQNLFEKEETRDPWLIDDDTDRLVARIVLSEAPFGPFDYLVPESKRAEMASGMRVRIHLGRGNRKLVGYCVGVISRSTLAAETDRRFAMKELDAVLDTTPLLSPMMLRLTEWMAQYYLCPWGQVLEAVVPAGVRGQAGTKQVTLLSVPTNVAARMTQLKLPKKQAEVLRCLVSSPTPMTTAQICEAVKCTSGPVRALRDKGLVQSENRRVHQHEALENLVTSDEPPRLNPHQAAAVDAVMSALRGQRHETFLVHGVTGSGKTEVYMRAIQEVLSYGRQAIVLVPEISLTPQTVSRFRARFQCISVLHSHLSPSERHWHWRQIAQGETQVIVGARSAVFAPTPHLGLIVLDEEHDSSFKQDTAPRYHARDVARRRGATEQIPVILGSATPSLESWQEARQQRYRLLELPQRVQQRPLPDVSVIDLRTEYQNRFHRGAISRPLEQAVKHALNDGGQVILLLNRRGFSTSIQCPACGEVVRCPDCDIALTHHREGEKAVCHYCDYKMVPPAHCPACGFEGIYYAGLGTQRLEAEVKGRFPKFKCLRMDSDTMRRPGSHEKAFELFRSGEVQILVGTQMIAKGLDIPNVTLVGVVNADTALHFPDFRAAERTFQLVTQVAGRTGRGERGGRVLVQTFSPEHPAIQAATRHDFLQFAELEWQERHEYAYPPAARLVRIIMRGPVEKTVEAAVEGLGEEISRLLVDVADARVLGPAPAPLAKLRGKFRFHLLLFAGDGAILRQAVLTATSGLQLADEVQWIVDVDPQDML
jgi:primosomal protein N' (replication factor Y)